MNQEQLIIAAKIFKNVEEIETVSVQDNSCYFDTKALVCSGVPVGKRSIEYRLIGRLRIKLTVGAGDKNCYITNLEDYPGIMHSLDRKSITNSICWGNFDFVPKSLNIQHPTSSYRGWRAADWTRVIKHVILFCKSVVTSDTLGASQFVRFPLLSVREATRLTELYKIRLLPLPYVAFLDIEGVELTNYHVLDEGNTVPLKQFLESASNIRKNQAFPCGLTQNEELLSNFDKHYSSVEFLRTRDFRGVDLTLLRVDDLSAAEWLGMLTQGSIHWTYVVSRFEFDAQTNFGSYSRLSQFKIIVNAQVSSIALHRVENTWVLQQDDTSIKFEQHILNTLNFQQQLDLLGYTYGWGVIYDLPAGNKVDYTCSYVRGILLGDFLLDKEDSSVFDDNCLTQFRCHPHSLFFNDRNKQRRVESVLRRLFR
jgi:hypothetical protein